MKQRDAHSKLIRQLGTACAVVAAAETGMLERLVRADAPIDDVAAATGLHPDGVERVLELLAAAGWVTREGGGWRAAGWIRDAELGGLTVDRTVKVFSHLQTTLRDGSVMMPGEVRHDAATVGGLARLFEEAASQLAGSLPPARGAILDLGAGSAVWSLAMANDEARIVAVDRAEVLEAARDYAAERGRSDRLELLPGSFWEVPLPRADRVVIANVVHLLDDAESRALVERAVSALKTGGELVLVDVITGETMSCDTAAYALHLRLREPHGTVHPTARMIGWLQEAGLGDVHAVPLESSAGAVGAIVGRR